MTSVRSTTPGSTRDTTHADLIDAETGDTPAASPERSPSDPRVIDLETAAGLYLLAERIEGRLPTRRAAEGPTDEWAYLERAARGGGPRRQGPRAWAPDRRRVRAGAARSLEDEEVRRAMSSPGEVGGRRPRTLRGDREETSTFDASRKPYRDDETSWGARFVASRGAGPSVSCRAPLPLRAAPFAVKLPEPRNALT